MSYSSKKNGVKLIDRRQRVHIHMDKQLKKRIDERAASLGINRSEYVNKILEKELSGRNRSVMVTRR